MKEGNSLENFHPLFQLIKTHRKAPTVGDFLEGRTEEEASGRLNNYLRISFHFKGEEIEIDGYGDTLKETFQFHRVFGAPVDGCE